MRHLILRLVTASTASAALFATANSTAHAQSFTALYDFTSQPGTEISAPVTSGVPTGVTFGDIVRGSDLKTNAGAKSINSAGWSTGGIDLNGYYGFTITPTAGESLTLSNLAFQDQKSATGPSTFEIRSSLDGFTSDLATYTETSGVAGTSNQSFTLSGLQALTGPITIEIFGYAATGSAGTYRLASTAAGLGLTVSGSLAPITGGAAAPEPGSVALLAAGLLPIGAVVRRRISRKA